jgi:thiosulfate/3-mercaptopyruvate sulfurtransferase
MTNDSVLIDALSLKTLLAKQATDALDYGIVLLDCRHDLINHNAGLAAFDKGHIPGAQFWNMETDAVAQHTGFNGRHPLASREQTRACFEKFGMNSQTLLIVYDGHGGQYAGRLWWLARWIGHSQVKLLDGGLQAWQSAGLDLTTDVNTSSTNLTKQELTLKPSLVAWVDKHQVALTSTKVSQSASSQVLDARAPARFRGDVEPLDPVAGHIPNALNRFYQDNLDSDGFFKKPELLRTEFEAIIGHRSPAEIIHQCGSGVTACHNLLAMELADLHGSALYPGSWSEWCTDLSLPVANGPS